MKKILILIISILNFTLPYDVLKNVKVKYGYLKEDTIINGVVYQSENWLNDISYYENGNVESGYLAANIKINGVIYKANSKIVLY